MAGQQVGYIRIRSFDQHPERQLDGLALNRVLTLSYGPKLHESLPYPQ